MADAETTTSPHAPVRYALYEHTRSGTRYIITDLARNTADPESTIVVFIQSTWSGSSWACSAEEWCAEIDGKPNYRRVDG